MRHSLYQVTLICDSGFSSDSVSSRYITQRSSSTMISITQSTMDFRRIQDMPEFDTDDAGTNGRRIPVCAVTLPPHTFDLLTPSLYASRS